MLNKAKKAEIITCVFRNLEKYFVGDFNQDAMTGCFNKKFAKTI